jgi:hypothetical protein
VADAANRGELSPEQVNAIADACEADAGAQQKLVAAAKAKPLSKFARGLCPHQGRRRS